MAENVVLIFTVFAIYAFIGWVTEVGYAYYKTGKWVNRGFLYGPFCPIYGAGAVAIILLVDYLKDKLTHGESISIVGLFLIVLVVTSGIEYLTGYFLEKMFHTKWWDYSEKRFNIKGYVCLRFSIYWGIIGSIVVEIIHPAILNGIEHLNQTFVTIFSAMLAAYFIIDGYHTVMGMINFRKLILEMERMSVQFKNDVERLSAPLKVEIERIRQEIEERTDEIAEKTEQLAEELKARKTTLEANLKDRLDLDDKLAFVENNLKELIEKRQFESSEIKDEIADRIARLRLYRAFPTMKSIRHPELLKPVRDKFKNPKFRK